MRETRFGKRCLTWVLVLMMTLSLLPVSALAEDGEARFYGKNVTIIHDCDNTSVSGTAVQSGNGQDDQSASVGTSEGGDQKDDGKQNTNPTTSGNGDAQSDGEENGQGTNGNGQSGDNGDQNGSDEKNEDEKCVAKIGEVKYETLKTAFAAAKSGDTIVLQKDIAESIEVRFKGELTLDLNKHSIDGGNTDRCIRSADNEELRPDKFTIKNGTLKNGKANGSTGGAILWYGNLTVENCWFENNQNCAIQVSKGGKRSNF